MSESATITTAPPQFLVKFREPGKRAYWFLASDGSGTRLRIHAAPHKGNRDEVLAKYASENPEFEFIAVLYGA